MPKKTDERVQFNFRTEPDIKAKSIYAAKLSNVSAENWLTALLRRHFGRKEKRS
jgi:hypothetical protein